MTDIREASSLPALVTPPLFDEPALSKPRPSAQQVASLQSAVSDSRATPDSRSADSRARRSPAQRAAATQRAERQAAVHRAAYQALAVMASAPAPSPTLRTRVPAYAVMTQCLKKQRAAPQRSWLARVFGREPLHPDARSWYRGALGELEVARILARLDKRWTVLHAVPVGSAGADIDHVVIGPGGTFTINTKNHGGKKIWTAGTGFMVNGQRLAHIHNSRFEAQRAARLLSDVAGTPVAVTPLIVVVNPESLTRKNPDVTVLDSAELFRWIRRQPQMQTDATVARIAWAAERRDTWTTLVDEAPSASVLAETVLAETGRAETGRAETGSTETGRAVAPPQPDIADLEERFAELRSAVESAQSRRHAWALLGAAAFVAGVFGAFVYLVPLIPAMFG